MAHDGRRPGADIHSTQDANLSKQASLWATPRAQDSYERSPQSMIDAMAAGEKKADMTTTRQARIWATPTSRDWKSDDATQSPEHSPPLGLQVLQTETDGDDGSKRAVLNPYFVEALMGFPPSWTVPTVCARSETPSSQHKPTERSGGSQEES